MSAADGREACDRCAKPTARRIRSSTWRHGWCESENRRPWPWGDYRTPEIVKKKQRQAEAIARKRAQR